MNIHIFIFSMFTVPIELYLFSDLIKDEFEKREWYRYAAIPVWLGCIILLSFVNSLEYFIGNFFCYTCEMIFFLLVLYRGEVIKKLVYVTLYSIISLVAEFIMGLTYFICISAPIENYADNLYSRTLSCIGVFIIDLILIKVWKRFFGKNKHDASEKTLGLLLLFPVLSGLINAEFMSLSSVISLEHYIRVYTLNAMLLAANFILFYYIERMMVLKGQQKEYALLQQKSEMERKYYKRMEEIDREHSIYRHDMKNYMEVIRRLAEEGKTEELKKVSGQINDKLECVERIRYTGNEILNAILWEKKEYAEKCDIKISMQIEPGVDISYIKDTDIIVMVGNVLDNAIEAAKLCTENRSIEISMFEAEGNFIIFYVQNHFVKAPIIRDGRLLTSKNDVKKHGMGVESVRRTVEKYGGILDIEIKEDIFSVTINIAIDYLKQKEGV